MKAMILAGGLSTRLYPLTKAVPKPLVPVAGEPNAAHLIRYLKSYGFDEIAINVHYLADAIVATLGDGSRFGVKLHYSYEPELLGSAGGVKKIEEYFGDDDFIVIGCDEVTDLRSTASWSFIANAKRSQRSAWSRAKKSISTASSSWTSAERSSAFRRSRRKEPNSASW